MKSYTVTIHTRHDPPQTESVEAATAVDAIQRALGAISPHAEVVGVEVGCALCGDRGRIDDIPCPQCGGK